MTTRLTSHRTISRASRRRRATHRHQESPRRRHLVQVAVAARISQFSDDDRGTPTNTVDRWWVTSLIVVGEYKKLCAQLGDAETRRHFEFFVFTQYLHNDKRRVVKCWS